MSVHHVDMGSKLAEALQNMKLSARGSIRKKTNIIQAVVMVKNLYQHGLKDFTLFVRKWNAMSAKADQIVGKKAMALKFLFDSTPQEPRVGRGGRKYVAQMLLELCGALGGVWCEINPSFRGRGMGLNPCRMS